MIRTLPMIPDADLVPPSSSSTAADDRGFGALRTEKGALPLESMDVRGRIDGLLARVLVHQTFVNAHDEPLEASYIFPLPDRAAVTRFRMIVAGREIEGVLEERGQAREHYDAAIAEGRRASIAEEDRPGVFNLRVGNLMPGERATVELTLCGVLPYADGEVTFRFPMVVAPRYIPGRPLPGPSVGDGTAVDTDAVPDASRISPPVLLPGFPNPVRLNLEVEVHDGGSDADDLRSSLHAVLEEERGGYRRIRIHPGERLDRDFILRFRLGGQSIRSTLTLHPDEDREGGTFAMTIVPPTGRPEATGRPRDVVFVLDRSGSMSGWKMVAARRALARMIDTLVDVDRFFVMAFDSVVESPKELPEGLTSASDRSRFRAVEFLATVEARGGTEMAGPLDRAANLLAAAESDDRDRILVLITDGQVGNEDQILAMLGSRLRKIRVFAIGIDRAVNEGFLRRLSEYGGGVCELVESEDRLDEAMAGIHKRIGMPMLSGLSLLPRGLAIEPGEVVPSRLPDLFAGSPLLILGRYRGRPEGAIELKAVGADGAAYSESVPGVIRPNSAISAAWARGRIRQLEDRYAAGERDRSNLEKAIVALSLRFQVLCRFTAYIAVDRSQVVNPGGTAHRITQPVDLPQGWAAPESMAMMTMAPTRAAGGMNRMPKGPGGGRRDARQREIASTPPMGQPPSPVQAPVPAAESIEDVAFADFHIEVPWTGGLLESLESEGPMAPRRAAEILVEVARALQRFHDGGEVYGWMETACIVIDGAGVPCLERPPGRGRSAFASVQADRGGVTSYTPPEWLREGPRDLGPLGDIYALGVVLYELLTGRRPFEGEPGTPSLVEEIRRGRPIPPRRIKRSIPAALEAICLKAMAADPARRYGTAGELADALDAFLRPRRKSFWK